MIKPGPAGRRRRSAFSRPNVQADVMMITTGRQEDGPAAITLRHLETQGVPVKLQRPVKIRDRQVNVPDPDIWMKRGKHNAMQFRSSSVPPVQSRSNNSTWLGFVAVKVKAD